ncbi:hypothetical protein [Trichothermofontia sp.]
MSEIAGFSGLSGCYVVQGEDDRAAPEVFATIAEGDAIMARLILRCCCRH